MSPGSVSPQPVPGPGQLPKPVRGEVVLWWATTDVSAATLEALRADLDDETRARANAFAREEDRRRAIVAHGLLRRVITASLGGEPRELQLIRRCVTCGSSDHGKPSLPLRDGGSLPPLQFNLAHSGPVVAVAIAAARTPVGVDVERIDQAADWEATRHHVFTAVEWEESAEAEDPPRERFQRWARKEAVLKATGDGLSLELSSVFTESGSDRFAFTPAAIVGQPSADLRVADVELTPGVAAAVALAGVASGPVRPITTVQAQLQRRRATEH